MVFYCLNVIRFILKTCTKLFLLIGFCFPILALLGEDDITNVRNAEVINSHIGIPMLDETRTLLNEFYKPLNIKLANYLNDSRFLWNS